MPPIDVDDPATWPEASRSWADVRAERQRADVEYTNDLEVALDEEDDFRATFGLRRLIAYHCTRLTRQEVDRPRRGGLQPLDEDLTRRRILAASEEDALSEAAYHFASTRNIYARRNTSHREHQVCFVIGRSAFDDEPWGLHPLLAHWGGEAMRGGPDDAPPLESVGNPAVVVAQLDLAGPHTRHLTFPSLGKLFVGRLLGTTNLSASVHYRAPVDGNDILDVWQPGHPRYDRHQGLPR